MMRPFSRPASVTFPTMAGRAKKAHGVREVEVDGTVTLYHDDLDRVLVLNPTAVEIWRRCNGETDDDAIVADLARLFAVDEAAIVDEVLGAIAELQREGFVKYRLEP